MSRSQNGRKKKGQDGICPRCGQPRLSRVVVAFKGSVDVCPGCGYERVIEPVRPDAWEREYWKWEEGLSERVLKFRGVEALLQSICEAEVCSACAKQAPIEELKAQAMELEHVRSYLAQGEIYTDEKMDAYQVQVVALLRGGVGQLCEPCWQCILKAMMRRFYGLYE